MPIRFWAIADTHLSFAKPKDMSRFGKRWINHTENIAAAWTAQVRPEDVVLLPGDVSWAQSPNKIMPDLEWLSALPGQKVLLRGNHDHWWKDITTARQLTEPLGFYVLEGDSIALDGVIICGAMGHIAPEDPYFAHDPKKDRFTRELKRLDSALSHATARRKPDQAVLLLMHYPPFTSDGQKTAYVEVINYYRPTLCIYGHLHRPSEWAVAKNGCYEGVRYILAAADFLDMKPRLVWPEHEE